MSGDENTKNQFHSDLRALPEWQKCYIAELFRTCGREAGFEDLGRGRFILKTVGDDGYVYTQNVRAKEVVGWTENLKVRPSARVDSLVGISGLASALDVVRQAQEAINENARLIGDSLDAVLLKDGGFDHLSIEQIEECIKSMPEGCFYAVTLKSAWRKRKESTGSKATFGAETICRI